MVVMITIRITIRHIRHILQAREGGEEFEATTLTLWRITRSVERGLFKWRDFKDEMKVIVSTYRTHATKGDPRSQNCLAIMYNGGMGVKK